MTQLLYPQEKSPKYPKNGLDAAEKRKISWPYHELNPAVQLIACCYIIFFKVFIKFIVFFVYTTLYPVDRVPA
jgi:hypothetical protein